ncbi:MAG: hypothetical protein ACOCV2_15705 [Persicimonas sp.]
MRVSRLGRAWATAFAACAVGLWALPADAQQTRGAQPAQPVLEEIGPWEVYAADKRVDGFRVVFEDVEASIEDGDLRLTAERLDVVRVPSRAEVASMSFTGNVRLVGLDDLYMTADTAWTLHPSGLLELVGSQVPTTAGGGDWRLGAERVRIELEESSVQLDGLIASGHTDH